jgi:DNA-binding transcriptional regulator YiaG
MTKTTTTTTETLGQTLISIRRKHGLSQSQCARLIPGMPLKMLQKYEQHASEPPVWVQLLLIDALIKKAKKIKSSVDAIP